MLHKIVKGYLLLSIISLAGCAPHTPMQIEARTAHATILAKTVHWQPFTIQTANFTFKAYGPPPKHSPTLTIYIEGDGLAWLSADTPSANPTPINPIGLEMAIRDKKHKHVVYLARACQFVPPSEWRTCHLAHWTSARFSPAIVAATHQAIDTLKIRYRAQKLILIGYSGGGAIATLVAAKRADVICLITIAGILDTVAWAHVKNLTPLYDSLNPADAWESLANTPQTHWVGGIDKVVPKEIAFSYASRFPFTKKPDIKIVPTFDHNCCWTTSWEP